MSGLSRSSAASPEPYESPRRTGERRENGVISPAPSTFSFDHEEPGPQGLRFRPDQTNEKHVSRKASRGTGVDGTLLSVVKPDPQTTSLSKKKSQFYSEVFAYREPNITIRSKVHQYSVITAELKTNIIIKDEYSILQDLSETLSQRYHRPTSSIFVTVTHSACLLFGGTFDSAYILTITALPSQIQPTTNKRNAALIQAFIRESLGVTPDRGVVRFVGIAEEFLATNGTTLLGEIENQSKTSGEENRNENSRLGVIRSLSRRTPKAKEMVIKEENILDTQAQTPSPTTKGPPLPAMPTEKSYNDRRAERVQKMGRRRSFLSMFGK